MEKLQSMNDKIKLAGRVAIFAAGFAALIAVLLIANYVQSRLNDPIENKTIPALVKRLNASPEDETLKSEIRAFDLMARKAYFTTKWQIRTGTYLMFLSLIISILSIRYLLAAKSKLSEIDPAREEKGLDLLIAQKWVIYTGSGLILLALVSGLLSYNSLKEYMVNETMAASTEKIDNPVLPASNQANNVQADSAAVQPKAKAEVSGPQVTKDSVSAKAATPSLPGLPTKAQLRANFPFFRGSEGTGVAFQKKPPVDWNGADGKNIRWKVKIPKPGFSSPIIWGNQIFVTGADAQSRMVYCYDRNSGKLLWEAAADKIAGSPAAMPKVTTDTGLAAPTMATDGRSVFALFATGDLLALDMNGKRIWAKNLGLPDNHYGHSSSLIVYKDKLLVQYDTNKTGKLLAFDSQTGNPAWETLRNSKISWSSPVLVNTGSRMELILTTNPNVSSYNPDTGKELWKIACLSGEVGPSAGYADGMVFAANEYAKLVGIKAGDSPQIVWEADEFLPEVSSPLAVNGLLYIATSYGVFACYDAKTGTKLWSEEYGDSFYSSPIYADGKVYLTNTAGKTYIVKTTRDYQLVGTPEIGERSVCSPVFMDGMAYLRGINQLYCIGSK
ncbi:MAG: PQQ-binding-like beta-propeller repeat protein [Prolixibacteraceae bacterium]